MRRPVVTKSMAIHTTTTSVAAPTEPILSPLRRLDAQAVSQASRKETRNREVHLPPVSVYRWWARRTESVNGAIVDAVDADRNSDRMLVVDPFAGGGVIPLAALLRGHQVYAQDINPWATKGLHAMLGLADPDAIREGVAALAQRIAPLTSAAYGTTLSDGQPGAVTHTFRVAVSDCPNCDATMRLFPHALVTLLARKERGGTAALLACRNGHITSGHHDRNTRCTTCRTIVDPSTAYTARRVATCNGCGRRSRLQELAEHGTWRWEVVLVERARKGVREIAVATPAEIAAANNKKWKLPRDLGAIPHGRETEVLRRHGFASWNDLYPIRQQHVIGRLLELAPLCSDDASVTALLETAIIGSVEMAGHCSRWDRWYLKSYETMAGHRFNFTTLTVEPNAWGNATSGRGTVLRRLDQLIKAATWLHTNTTVGVVAGPIDPTDGRRHSADVVVAEGSSETMALGDNSADLVLTDPPYHDDVQYSELSLPFRTWANLDVSTGVAGDAVVNAAIGHNDTDGDYSHLLGRIFTESRRVLKPDGHLIFSYANRSVTAWIDVLAALEQAGLRAAGCEIVHSENERDHAKRGIRACTLDLVLDLVPQSELAVEPTEPGDHIAGDEADFLRTISTWVLRVGDLPDGWQTDIASEVNMAAFLA